MKKILFAFGILISYLSQGQTIQYLGTPTTQIYVRGQLRVDSIFYLPLRDTTFTPSQVGALVVKSSNNGVYLWNGLKWNTIPVGSTAWGTITGSISSQTDLITLLNGYQPILTAGYGIKLVSNTLSWDSTNVRKVDTVYRTNDSTITYAINGHTYSVLIRGTAAGGINSLIFNVPGVLYASPIVFSNGGAGAWSGTEVLNSQTSNTFFSGPTTGSPAQPTFRALLLADLPTGIPNGNLANSTIGLTLSNAGSSPNWGAASVALGGSAVLNLPNSSSTTSGILSNTDWINFNAATSPPVTSVNGQLGTVVVGNADSIKKLPIDTSNNRNGYALTFDSVLHKWKLSPGSTTSGTVTSVAMTVPSILSVSGSPVTGSGTLGVSLINQSANLIFAGPATGSPALPSFRSFVNADLPASGVSAGTYNSVTLNAQGIATAASNVGSGITSLNGLTGGTQTFATGTGGSNFNISSVGTTHTFNIPDASATNRGALTSADWSSFNAKKDINDSVGSNGYATNGHLYKSAIDSMKGVNDARYLQGPAKSLYGIIYDSSIFTTLAPFTANSVTASIVSNKISVVSAAGSFSATLALSSYGSSCLQYEKSYVRYKVNMAPASATFAGIGKISTNTYSNGNISGILNLTNGASAGKLQIYGNANALLLTTGTGISFSQNDFVEQTVERIGNVVVATARNVTTNGAAISLTYQYTAPSGSVVENTGQFAFYALSGNYIIDSLSFSSNETINSDYIVVGDSKEYYYPSGFANSWVELLRRQYPGLVRWSGPGDRTTDVIARLKEAKRLAGKVALLAIFSNDKRSGISDATSQAQYHAIRDSLVSYGYRVIHLLPFYETSIDLSSDVAYVRTTYAGIDSIVNTFDPLRILGCLNADGIHPSDLGHRIIADAITQSYLLSNGSSVNFGTSISNQTAVPQTAGFNITGSPSFINSQLTIGDGVAGVYQHDLLLGPNMRMTFLNFSNENYLLSTDDTHTNGRPLKIGANKLSFGVRTTGYAENMYMDSTGTYIGNSTANSIQTIFKTGTDLHLNVFSNGTTNFIESSNAARTSGQPFTFDGSYVAFNNNITGSGEIGRFSAGGNLLIKTILDSSSYLHIGAGDATHAPLKLTAGTVLTTPKNGTIEFDGAHYYGTAGGTRSQLDNTSSGVTTVGSFSGSSQTNGASISTNTITFGPADGTNPGMMSTGTQTFAGAKTFNTSPIVPTASLGTNNATVASTGYVDGSLTAYAAIKFNHTIFTPTTGGTVSLVNQQYNIINPAGALLALTVNLPSSPINNDVVFIKFTQNVTTVTYANGTVVDGITAPTAGGLTVLTYDAGTASWY